MSFLMLIVSCVYIAVRGLLWEVIQSSPCAAVLDDEL